MIGEISSDLKVKFESIESLLCLSLNNCGLTTLNNFPKLPGLIRLEIMDNSFPGLELNLLGDMKGIQSLSLANNKISELAELKPLVAFENLVQMDLSECPISERENYRSEIFGMFSSLHILDNMDSEGKPFEYSDDSDVDGMDGAKEDEEDDDVDEEEDNDFVTQENAGKNSQLKLKPEEPVQIEDQADLPSKNFKRTKIE